MTLAYAKEGKFPDGYRSMTEAEAALDDALDTRDEPWTVEPPEVGHVYNAAYEFALRTLDEPRQQWFAGAFWGKCLVVGSPLFEAQELEDAGWIVTVVDVRNPNILSNQRDWSFIQADASSLPMLDESFDALSSTCVLCHVGLGRYGDPIVEDGDRKALKEFARVLKPGGRAAICFGPCVMGLGKTVTMGRVHRIYSTNDAMDMTAEAGLTPVDAAVWCSHQKRWLAINELDDRVRTDVQGGKLYYCYLMMALEKPK